MACGPLADDWLFWDAETIFAYPHSLEPCPRATGSGEATGEPKEPLQLELFEARPVGVASPGRFQSADEPVLWTWGSPPLHLNAELFSGDGDMFHRRKKEIPLPQRRCRANIIQEAMTLIALANEAERESLRSGDAGSTDAQDLDRAKGVLEAQTALTERIVLSQSCGLTMREISRELIQPVLDRSVVGDVAQLALQHALRSAENKLVPG